MSFSIFVVLCSKGAEELNLLEVTTIRQKRRIQESRGLEIDVDHRGGMFEGARLVI